MKKFSLLLIASLFGVLSTQAQANSDLVQWGIKGGLTLSSISGDNFESPDYRTGFYAGLTAELPFTERFSLQPELLYAQQGFKIADNSFGSAKYKLDYITIPILFKYYLVQGLNIQAGPQIGFNINDEIEYKSDWGSSNINNNEYSQVEDLDFGIIAGLEYKFYNGLFINANYTYGFTKLIKDLDIHNSGFRFGIGMMF